MKKLISIGSTELTQLNSLEWLREQITKFEEYAGHVFLCILDNIPESELHLVDRSSCSLIYKSLLQAKKYGEIDSVGHERGIRKLLKILSSRCNLTERKPEDVYRLLCPDLLKSRRIDLLSSEGILLPLESMFRDVNEFHSGIERLSDRFKGAFDKWASHLSGFDLEEASYICLPNHFPYYVPPYRISESNYSTLVSIVKDVLVHMSENLQSLGLNVSGFNGPVDPELATEYVENSGLFFDMKPMWGVGSHGSWTHIFQLLMLPDETLSNKNFFAKLSSHPPGILRETWFDTLIDSLDTVGSETRGAMWSHSVLLTLPTTLGQFSRLLYELVLYEQQKIYPDFSIEDRVVRNCLLPGVDPNDQVGGKIVSFCSDSSPGSITS